MRSDPEVLVLVGFVVMLAGLGMFVLASLFAHVWLAVLVSGVVVLGYGMVQQVKTNRAGRS